MNQRRAPPSNQIRPGSQKIAYAPILPQHSASPILRRKVARLAKGRSELVQVLKAEIERGETKGPYGAFPSGPLSAEDTAGLIYRVADSCRPLLGERLAAAL